MSWCEIRFPKHVYAGQGCLEGVAETVRRAGAMRVCVVTDASMIALGLCDRVCGALGMDAARVGSVPAEPTVDDLLRVFSEVLSNTPDFLIAVGGGSVMDVGKLVSAMLTNPAFAANPRDASLIQSAPVPLAAVPTTAGTGSEATANAILLFPEEALKVGIIHPRLLPPCVALDPDMTVSLPRGLTATTGVDALCHAVESFWSKKNNPLSEPLALAAIERITRSLERACADGADIAAREDLQIGAFYAGACLTSSTTTAVHALSYPLGGAFHVPHGLANAMLLPYVMRRNLPAAREKLRRIAPLFGAETPEGVVDETFALMARLGIPARLSAVGVRPEHLDALVAGALKVQRLLSQNPLPMEADDVRSLYLEML